MFGEQGFSSRLPLAENPLGKLPQQKSLLCAALEPLGSIMRPKSALMLATIIIYYYDDVRN